MFDLLILKDKCSCSFCKNEILDIITTNFSNKFENIYIGKIIDNNKRETKIYKIPLICSNCNTQLNEQLYLSIYKGILIDMNKSKDKLKLDIKEEELLNLYFNNVNKYKNLNSKYELLRNDINNIFQEIKYTKHKINKEVIEDKYNILKNSYFSMKYRNKSFYEMLEILKQENDL